MDYRSFVDQGRAAWGAQEERFERVERSGLGTLDHDELEELAACHRKIVSDFSYARSHFAGTEVVARLRRLAFAGHRHLRRRHERFFLRIWHFLRWGFRERFREALPVIGVSLGVFLATTLLGALLTLINEDFAARFIGPERLAMVRAGEIWTDQIGQTIPGSELSGHIATNNLRVLILAWLGGALFGLGSLVILSSNGLMFGSILCLIWQYGLLDRLFAFIGAHGPLELFLIVVSAAAGLEIGRGMVVATNQTRSAAIARSGRLSGYLILGASPWILFLGFVEGYVSPVMELPTLLKGLIGLGLLAIFLTYALSPVRKEQP